MKEEKLFHAITHLPDEMIEFARENGLKRLRVRRRKRIALIAAVLAVIIVATSVLLPHGGLSVIESTCLSAATSEADSAVPKSLSVSKAVYPSQMLYPKSEDYLSQSGELDYNAYNNAYDQWLDEKTEQRKKYSNTCLPTEFFKKTASEFLGGATSENVIYSPVNLYIALSAFAELTDNESREQILALLGYESIEESRKSASDVWNLSYQNDGVMTSVLANSVWLNEDVSFVKKTMDILSSNYYTSSYKGEMGSKTLNDELKNWLNEQTGGLLEDTAGSVELDSRNILALASSVYFQAEWDDEFLENKTEEGIFHTPTEDVKCSFMNTSSPSEYYWGENFSSVSRSFSYGGEMMFILPDEDTDVQSLINDEQVLRYIYNTSEYKNSKYITVNLSVAKFDVTSSIDLIDGLKNLGVTDIFNAEKSDFSPMTKDAQNIILSQAEHSARVMIDEKGCSGAAYTVLAAAGLGVPPEEEVNFVLNRPFMFVVKSSMGVPMFIGIINTP